MRVQNKIDRYNLVIDALKYLPEQKESKEELLHECEQKLIFHKKYISEVGEDMEDIKRWKWNL